jgi:hypothetical protein
MARKPGPYCPDCGADPPLKLLVWGLGKPFTCKACGTQLMVPKFTGMGFAITGILAFWKFKDAYDSGWWKLALFCGILFIAGVFGWYAMKVRKVAPPQASSPGIPGSG